MANKPLVQGQSTRDGADLPPPPPPTTLRHQQQELIEWLVERALDSWEREHR